MEKKKSCEYYENIHKKISNLSYSLTFKISGRKFSVLKSIKKLSLIFV